MKNFLNKLLCITILFSIIINATACFWTNKKVSLVNDDLIKKFTIFDMIYK